MSSQRLVGAAKSVGKVIVIIPTICATNTGAVVALEKLGLLDFKDFKAGSKKDDLHKDGDPGPHACDLGVLTWPSTRRQTMICFNRSQFLFRLSPSSPARSPASDQYRRTLSNPTTQHRYKISNTHRNMVMPLARVFGAAKPVGKIIAWAPIAFGAHFLPMYAICKSGFLSEEQMKRAINSGQGKPQHMH